MLAWRDAGLDPVECMRKCASVTGEFTYDEKEERVRNRLRPKVVNSKTFLVRNRPLAEVLDPQPRCSAVLHRLLEWIDRCDYASQRGESKPPCRQEDGTPIIPTDDDDLWCNLIVHCSYVLCVAGARVMGEARPASLWTGGSRRCSARRF